MVVLLPGFPLPPPLPPEVFVAWGVMVELNVGLALVVAPT